MALGIEMNWFSPLSLQPSSAPNPAYPFRLVSLCQFKHQFRTAHDSAVQRCDSASGRWHSALQHGKQNFAIDKTAGYLLHTEAELNNSAPTAHISGETQIAEGALLSYYWQLVKRPNNSQSEVTNKKSVVTNFIADAAGVYVGRLIVSDGVHSSTPQLWTVQAQ